MRSDDALATILVVSRLADEGTQPLKASEYWRLLDHIGDPGALLGPTASQLIGDLDAELADRVTRLLDRATSIAFELERLDQSGITTLTPFDAAYPRRWVDRLGPGAPPVVHTAGPLVLLQQTAVGILGSADAEEVASELAAQAVRLGSVVVTTDASFDGGAGEGGRAVAVLADPLLRTARHPEVRRAVIAGTRLLCTPYAPDARATAAARTGRDRLIHALSRLSVVVATEPSGDPWTGAVGAIDAGFTVAVWRGPGEADGNAALEAQGATPIRSVDDLARLLDE